MELIKFNLELEIENIKSKQNDLEELVKKSQNQKIDYKLIEEKLQKLDEVEKRFKEISNKTEFSSRVEEFKATLEKNTLKNEINELELEVKKIKEEKEKEVKNEILELKNEVEKIKSEINNFIKEIYRKLMMSMMYPLVSEEVKQSILNFIKLDIKGIYENKLQIKLEDLKKEFQSIEFYELETLNRDLSEIREFSKPIFKEFVTSLEKFIKEDMKRKSEISSVNSELRSEEMMRDSYLQQIVTLTSYNAACNFFGQYSEEKHEENMERVEEIKYDLKTLEERVKKLRNQKETILNAMNSNKIREKLKTYFEMKKTSEDVVNEIWNEILEKNNLVINSNNKN